MAQGLYIGDNKWIKVDRTFAEGEVPARMGVSGGHVVQLSAAVSGRPMIHQAGGGFYYHNGSPVTDPEHVQHLPQPYLAQALAFIAQSKGQAKPLKPVKTTPTEDGRPVPPTRGKALRGGPRQVKTEQDHREMTGGITVEESERLDAGARR